ncbi:DUF1697 domain-containing protein [soil metagenome]
MIKMADLKVSFEKAGFTNILTYINSGNVIFESTGKTTQEIIDILEKKLSKDFDYESHVVVRSQTELKKMKNDAPKSWTTSTDLRRYVGFLQDATLTKEAIAEIPVREGVDELDHRENVLYMTTKLAEKTKSGFTRMIGKPIYKKMTIRDYKTVLKVLALMEK